MLDNLETIIKTVNGTRRNRTLSLADGELFSELFTEHKDDPEIHTIRVYAHQGFVPHAYKYRCDISALVANRNKETGEWSIGGIVVDAKRPHGQGPLATINGRAVGVIL